MKKQKRRIWNKLLTLLLALVLLTAPALYVSAAHVSAREAIGVLDTLGLFRGDGTGFAPERGATRAEALVMLLRLLGREDAALAEKTVSPYTDAGWAADYIGYAWKNGLVNGVGGSRFGSEDPVGARDYVTMLLRALGYRDAAGAFSWADSLRFSDEIGLTNGEYRNDDVLLREDLALISYTALTLKLADGSMTLAERLYLDGAVTAQALLQTRLAGAVHAGRRSYTAAELYERSASAVFLTESYDSAEDMEEDEPVGTASGFFIAPDGLALMSWHQLDGASCVRATTMDGRCYPLTEVLFFDPLKDIALVRIGRTDADGETVRFFPWLPLGDPEAVSVGEEIFTVSNPNGLRDCISSGVLSAKKQIVEDPAYPMLQFTAPISHGSSGGALLNRFGDVIGVLYGSFVEGQLLNLAVPVLRVDPDSLPAGRPLPEIRGEQDEKKQNAVITADCGTELRLTEGEKLTLTVSSDWPGQPGIRYDIDDTRVVGCVWGSYRTKQSVDLTVEAKSAGETTVRISFTEDMNDYELAIRVTVEAAEKTGE